MSLIQHSHLLALPAELRLEIYKALLPYKSRIHLDKRHIQRSWTHGNYHAVSRDVTLPLMLTCKRIQAEVTEFVFAHNIVVVQQPWKDDLFLSNLGANTREFIRNLHVDLVSGIGDLGRAWKTMGECPKLNNLI